MFPSIPLCPGFPYYSIILNLFYKHNLFEKCVSLDVFKHFMTKTSIFEAGRNRWHFMKKLCRIKSVLINFHRVCCVVKRCFWHILKNGDTLTHSEEWRHIDTFWPCGICIHSIKGFLFEMNIFLQTMTKAFEKGRLRCRFNLISASFYCFCVNIMHYSVLVHNNYSAIELNRLQKPCLICTCNLSRNKTT